MERRAMRFLGWGFMAFCVAALTGCGNLAARSRAMASISRVKSIPVTFAAPARAKASVRSPVPQATSSTTSDGLTAACLTANRRHAWSRQSEWMRLLRSYVRAMEANIARLARSARKWRRARELPFDESDLAAVARRARQLAAP